jgi:hypothetical protein
MMCMSCDRRILTSYEANQYRPLHIHGCTYISGQRDWKGGGVGVRDKPRAYLLKGKSFKKRQREIQRS